MKSLSEGSPLEKEVILLIMHLIFLILLIWKMVIAKIVLEMKPHIPRKVVMLMKELQTKMIKTQESMLHITKKNTTISFNYLSVKQKYISIFEKQRPFCKSFR